jgi:hypothetical protein
MKVGVPDSNDRATCVSFVNGLVVIQGLGAPW